MKPTKEQLADPKWWDENAEGYDHVFYHERLDEYSFASGAGLSEEFKLHIDVDAWQLLAKRPESKWVPKPMQVCEINFPLRSWTKVQFIGMDKDEYFVCEYMNGELEKFKGSGIDFRPIKTQRDELIDIIDTMCAPANEVADAILARYYLTKKDGE